MNSKELFEESKKFIPGGVNSPVRAFKGVGGTPFFVKSASGCNLISCDGEKFTDFVCSWGPAIFGHSHPRIKAAIARALENGTSFGAPCELELEMAKLINGLIPCAEMVRMTNSGTEAAMSAVRLARGFTKRDLIVKFAGCYHGHADSLLVKAGSGAATFGNPDSAGVPADFAKLTRVLPFNDFDAAEECFSQEGERIAAVILEAFPANAGLILPKENFLKKLRELCSKHGAVLIFDEVITGFRLGLGGAQKLAGVIPDLCVLGKIIGGGLPVGAFAGRREIMERLSPVGPVYQAGTLSGNPLAMAAGAEALKMIIELDPYAELKRKSDFITSALRQAAKERGVALQVPQAESLFSIFFNENPVENFEGALKSSTALYAKHFKYCLERGVYIAPSAFEVSFMSLAHDGASLERAAEVMASSIKNL
ncbi:MAG: glutamate-1-semialdehyde 2,1-aminomutase [Opitutales bacterium]|nr:glutamate-1-semialdehyde 2,1-aminomutase [Opitutales bacterium]